MTKKITKALALTVCAVLLVCGSVLGTMAYLTSTATVQNTFTVGNVSITLDELKTDVYGKSDQTETRVDSSSVIPANQYKLVPGRSYEKNTVVHVAENSEKCYLFAKLDGALTHNKVAVVLGANWELLDAQSGIYYYKVPVETSGSVQDIEVVKSFSVAADAVHTDISGISASANIVAYAVQADGFNSASEAWAATFGKNQPQTQTED